MLSVIGLCDLQVQYYGIDGGDGAWTCGGCAITGVVSSADEGWRRELVARLREVSIRSEIGGTDGRTGKGLGISEK